MAGRYLRLPRVSRRGYPITSPVNRDPMEKVDGSSLQHADDAFSTTRRCCATEVVYAHARLECHQGRLIYRVDFGGMHGGASPGAPRGESPGMWKHGLRSIGVIIDGVR